MNLTASASSLQRLSTAWNRFWFTPGDPTVLGAIRILTGVLTFYTLLCYSFDLQEQVGEHAWLDLQLREVQYREGPTRYIALEWDWQDSHYQAPVTQADKEYALS